jgi:hypothetical protein
MLLRKLRDGGVSFNVTADPMALQLEPSVEQIYLSGHAVERQRILDESRDPIITVSHNNVTAVLAQFGDFMWELEAVEDVVSSTPLPVK